MIMMRAAVVVAAVLAIGSLAGAATPPPAPAPWDLAPVLQPILDRHKLPGMVGAVVEGDRAVAIGAVGVRRAGSPDRVTPDDRFHIGSCTKAMTATLIAMLVEEKKLAWSTTLAQAFPDLAARMTPAYRAVTLEQLLTHRGGLPQNLDAGGLWGRLWNHTGTPVEQRLALVEGVLTAEPEAPPGTKYIYSNAGYAVAGAMAEKAASRPWEDLMRERLFAPLGMTSAGFGAPGTKDVLDQPRGHDAAGRPVEPGPGADNPAAIGPGGTVHCTIGDWAKFVALHLAGEGPAARLLPAETFRKLHTPVPDPATAYAMGWLACDRPWGGGRVLTHAGTNTRWYAVAWLAPKRNFAVLVACNQGGDPAAKACDEAAAAMIQEYLGRKKVGEGAKK